MNSTPAEAARDIAATFIPKIASELKLPPTSVAAAARLLADGATVPFIARYRKEATGSLDEVAITAESSSHSMNANSSPLSWAKL